MKRDRSLGIFSFLNIVFAILEAFIVIKVSSLPLAQPRPIFMHQSIFIGKKMSTSKRTF